ncbi:Nramp family divalent metal transporter [Umezawaea beigongshangensis]|uniref:Nramp family divalent metal transporter n=1 Tax=Umezawaea beigongshangensis TaxID=2780383 RepID=UPI0018F1EDE5|nr:Nramp family divalent metal transporter [Umezawaea beigongshangensis]
MAHSTALRTGPATSRSRARALLTFAGPGCVVAVAYVDPGNFATNTTGGSRYGFLLLWVIVAANVVAMFVQYLSAKLGLATGKDLATLCREETSTPVRVVLWAQAELVAVATDLAEFVGGAVALHLLFGVPVLPAAIITGVVSFVILAISPSGRRRFETVIGTLLLVILVGFLYQVLRAGPTADVASGLVPRFAGTDSVLLATGILGATVMPHVIYLHSALSSRHSRALDPAAALRGTRVDLISSLGVAGLINASMLIVAALVFHPFGGAGGDTLEGVHAGLGAAIGTGAALAFALALLASGVASASVGTYAGQVIMAGFLNVRIPLALRRLLTMLPALAVLALGIDPTRALVLSQVVLSFGIPFALVPLVLLTRRADLMGALVNRRVTTWLAGVVAAAIIGLNAFLLVSTFGG